MRQYFCPRSMLWLDGAMRDTQTRLSQKGPGVIPILETTHHYRARHFDSISLEGILEPQIDPTPTCPRRRWANWQGENRQKTQ